MFKRAFKNLKRSERKSNGCGSRIQSADGVCESSMNDEREEKLNPTRT